MRTKRFLALLAALTMVLAACGSTTDTTEAPETTSAPEVAGEDALRVAIVAPSAKDDLAFSQSMVDSVNALDRDIDLAITDGTFIVEDAAAAIRAASTMPFPIPIASDPKNKDQKSNANIVMVIPSK